MKLQTSPYNTRQEEYREDPWKMLMICFMLNQTSHKQVDQVRQAFFDRFPSAEKLVLAEESEIASMIKSLGFYNRRAKSWKEFSLQWIEEVRSRETTNLPVEVLSKMKGVGKYALDSWKVFQLFEYDTQVDDHVLNWYVDWARVEKEKQIRESLPWKPMLVYYLHFKDDRFTQNNWNTCRDYSACVMARTQNEAIEKVTAMVEREYGYKYIKIMGFGHAKEEWVNEQSPLKTDEDLYAKQVTAMFNRIYANKTQS
jgi:endonuclease III